ncbi:MAG: selenide, water dikinase [candidate division Zixibacteria bacterium SM23_73]|nr:MAG: selenide, water dikinase [candidate division Zixibacteria bacterium SM23_73]
MPKTKNPNVLVGFNSVDDAGVYKIRDDLALVQTVDFFPPVVDDPYDFGAIAAANSLSDIYAMGGKPLSALNLLGFPPKSVPLWAVDRILRGGAEKAQEADVVIIGGHTLKTKEPLYGMAVTGTIHPDKIISNANAKVGDSLVLTKPLGIGLITTAIKKEQVEEKWVAEAVKVMTFLNKFASEAMLDVGIDACTDITGYGLLGHLYELIHASKVGARIYLSKVQVIDFAWELAQQKIVPGGTLANLKFIDDKVDWDKEITEEAKLILSDAQTSGGLLIAVAKEKEQKLLDGLISKGVPNPVVIGEIIEDKRCRIQVKS